MRYTTYPETIELTTGIQFLDLTFTGAFTVTEWLAIGATSQGAVMRASTPNRRPRIRARLPQRRQRGNRLCNSRNTCAASAALHY